MCGKFIIAMLFGICCLSLCGCLYRGDGVFKQIGDSDYKARVSLMNLVVVADGKPTYVSGTVLLEDHVTPLKGVHVILRKKDQAPVVANGQTDHIGNFSLTGLFSHDSYTIEVDSSEYAGGKTIMVEPNRDNWHEIFVNRR